MPEFVSFEQRLLNLAAVGALATVALTGCAVAPETPPSSGGGAAQASATHESPAHAATTAAPKPPKKQANSCDMHLQAAGDTYKGTVTANGSLPGGTTLEWGTSYTGWHPFSTGGKDPNPAGTLDIPAKHDGETLYKLTGTLRFPGAHAIGITCKTAHPDNVK